MPVTVPSAYFYPAQPTFRVNRPSDRPYVALGVANTGSGAITLQIGPDSWPVAPATQTVLPLPLEQVPITLSADAFTRVSFTWYLPSDLDAANGIGGSLSQYQSGPIPGPPNNTVGGTGSVTTAGTWQFAIDASPPTYTNVLILSNTGSATLQWAMVTGVWAQPNPVPPEGPVMFTQAPGAPPIVLPLGGVIDLGVAVTSSTAGATYGVFFSGV
jgi:hypothetical protein